MAAFHLSSCDNSSPPEAVTIQACLPYEPTFLGTNGDDHLIGTDGDDIFFTGNGNDTIYSGSGNDIICAGDGRNTIWGQSGDDYIISGRNNDNIYGGPGKNHIESGAGFDVIDVTDGNSVVFAEEGRDTIWGIAPSKVVGHPSRYAGDNNIDGGQDIDFCASSSNDTTTNCEIAGGSPAGTELIFFVMLDDADFHDFGYNSADAVTPNIDSLASEGVTLSRYYASSPICSPTRLSVLTGDNPARYGLNRLWPDAPANASNNYYFGTRGIPPSEETLGKSLQAAGYNTYHIGKWHVGKLPQRFNPASLGFDEYAILKAAPYEGVLNVETADGIIQTPPQKWTIQYQADEIIQFLKKNRGQKTFVNWWPIIPHTPIYIPPTFTKAENGNCCDFDTNTQRGKLLSMMYAWDKEFGRVLQHIKDEGLLPKTTIIVTSDNGGYRYALSPQRALRGSKGTLNEGGVRVPFVAHIGGTKPLQKTLSAPMASIDIFPTIMGLSGLNLPQNVDGINLAPSITSGSNWPRADPMFFQYRAHSWRQFSDESKSDTLALTHGCLKVLRDVGAGDHHELYDVCNDELETNNLANKSPQMLAYMTDRLNTVRLEHALLIKLEDVFGPLTLEKSDNLDISHDDLSIYTTILPNYSDESHNIYRRGSGIALTLDAKTENLKLALTGVSSRAINPPLKTVTLEAYYPRDGQEHKIALVIRGYLRGQSSVSLYIDGRLAAANKGDVGSQEAKTGLLSIIPELEPAGVGDSGIRLQDFVIFRSAIEPAEI